MREWERRYPDAKMPSKATVHRYMKYRMKLSYKDRKYEPDVRNHVKHKRHRCWLISQLYTLYTQERTEVIWFDEKGFQTLDSGQKRWQIVG